jgi:hypothetical protein
MSHALKCEYVGGVLPHERHLCERFEEEMLPYLVKMGPYIGELAMEGHAVCEEIMLRHNGMLKGGPEQRQWNYNRLVRCLRKFRAEWGDMKRSIAVSTGGAVH